MDVLSSQANLSGYKSVLLAAAEYQAHVPNVDDGCGYCKACTCRDHGGRVLQVYKQLRQQNVWVLWLKQRIYVRRQEIRWSAWVANG